MHLLLTDRLTCPRCGARHGLILLAERIDERRVLEGKLGCSNCREGYPVREGFGDLRPPPRSSLPDEGEAPPRPPAEETTRLAALLGVTEGPGFLLLDGAASAHAPALAAEIPEIEVVATDPLLRTVPERPGVSRMAAGVDLPFFAGTFRGVAVAGHAEPGRLDELVRVLAPRARLVVLGPPESTPKSLRDRGMEVVLEHPEAVVAVRT